MSMLNFLAMNKLNFRAAKAHQVRWKMIIVYLVVVVVESHGCEFSEGSLARELPAGPQSANNVATDQHSSYTQHRTSEPHSLVPRVCATSRKHHNRDLTQIARRELATTTRLRRVVLTADARGSFIGGKRRTTLAFFWRPVHVSSA